MKNQQLEPGDKIYKLASSTIIHIYTIKRVTSKQAVSSIGTKFKREVVDGKVKVLGSSFVFSMYSYYLETPDLIQRRKNQLLIGELNKAPWHLLSTTALNRMVRIKRQELLLATSNSKNKKS